MKLILGLCVLLPCLTVSPLVVNAEELDSESSDLELLLDITPEAGEVGSSLIGNDCFAGPGNNATSRNCGFNHPLIQDAASKVGAGRIQLKSGSCKEENGSGWYGVKFTIVGPERECDIACVYSPPAGSSRKGAKCTCMVYKCRPDYPGLPFVF